MPSWRLDPARPRLRREGDSRWTIVGTLLASATIAVAEAGLGLLTHWLPMPWKPAIVLATFARYLMWAAPIGVLLAGVIRRWVALGAGVVATALVLVVQVPLYVAATVPAHGPRLTVMQANLKIGGADAAAIVRLATEHQVDLLATEELTTAEQQRLLAAGLSRVFRYRYTAPLPTGGGGLGVWSRYPLADQVNLPGYQLGVLHVRVMLPDGTRPTFVAVHLLPPYPYPSSTWRREIGRLKGVLHTLPADAPVLVAGDFNATTDHAQFRDLLTDGYADAAGQAGAGYPSTYPTDRSVGPVIAIDHVLTRAAVATALDTLTLPGSDHRGLLARVVLTH